jgi:hypothetical protein
MKLFMTHYIHRAFSLKYFLSDDNSILVDVRCFYRLIDEFIGIRRLVGSRTLKLTSLGGSVR